MITFIISLFTYKFCSTKHTMLRKSVFMSKAKVGFSQSNAVFQDEARQYNNETPLFMKRPHYYLPSKQISGPEACAALWFDCSVLARPTLVASLAMALPVEAVRAFSAPRLRAYLLPLVPRDKEEQILEQLSTHEALLDFYKQVKWVLVRVCNARSQ